MIMQLGSSVYLHSGHLFGTVEKFRMGTENEFEIQNSDCSRDRSFFFLAHSQYSSKFHRFRIFYFRSSITMSMISTHPSEVPQYLRDSAHFKSLNAESDDEFMISEANFKQNTTLSSKAKHETLALHHAVLGLEGFHDGNAGFPACW